MLNKALPHVFVAFLMLAVGLAPAASSAVPQPTETANVEECADYEYLREAIQTEGGPEALFGMDLYMGLRCIDNFAGGLAFATAAGFAAPATAEPCIDLSILPLLPGLLSGSIPDVTVNEILGQAFGISRGSSSCVSLTALTASCGAVQYLAVGGLTITPLRCDLLLSSSGAAQSEPDAGPSGPESGPGDEATPIVDCTVRQLVIADGLSIEFDGAACLADAEVLNAAESASSQTWFNGASADNTCGILYWTRGISEFVAVPCHPGTDTASVPAVLTDGCAELDLSPISFAVLCGQQAAAGAACPLDNLLGGLTQSASAAIPCLGDIELPDIDDLCGGATAQAQTINVPCIGNVPVPTVPPTCPTLGIVPGFCGKPLPTVPPTCPTLGIVPGFCGKPLPTVPPTCPTLRSVPGFCGTPLPSPDPCDYLPMPQANIALPCGGSIDQCDYLGNVPGQCGRPLPPTDPCAYLGPIMPNANIALPCGGSIDQCDYIGNVPGQCGKPLPPTDPCAYLGPIMPNANVNLPCGGSVDECDYVENVPGQCGEPMPSDDPCDYIPRLFQSQANINLPCGNVIDECDYIGDNVPGQCGEPMPSDDPCDYIPRLFQAQSNIVLPCDNVIDECDYLGDVPGQCDNPPVTCETVYDLAGIVSRDDCVPDYCDLLEKQGGPVSCGGSEPEPCDGTRIDGGVGLFSVCVPDHCQYFNAEGLPVSCGGEPGNCDGMAAALLLQMQVCVPDYCPYLDGSPVSCVDDDTEPCPGYGVNTGGIQICAPDHCPYLTGNPVVRCEGQAEPCEGIGNKGQGVGLDVCVPEPCAFLGSGTIDSNLPICATDCDEDHQVNAPGMATYCVPDHCAYVAPLIPPASDEPLVGTGGGPADAEISQTCGLSTGHICYAVRLVAAAAALVWGPPPTSTSLYYGIYACGLYVPQTAAMAYYLVAPLVAAASGPVGGVVLTALALTISGPQTIENTIFGAPQRPSAPSRGGPQAAAGGEWHVVIGRGYIAANSLPEGEDNAPAGITVPLAIPDQGTISQRTVPTLPPSPVASREHKPDYAKGAWHAFQCGMGAIGVIAGSGVLVAGVATLDPPVALAGALLVTSAAGGMASDCPAAYKELSGGYYWCVQAAGRVDWGGGGGNNYAGGGSIVALPYYSSSAHDGAFTQSFPYGPAGSDGSWSAGKRACQEAYQAAVDAVNQAASEFMSTNHLEGDASLTFVVETPNVGVIPGDVIGELRDSGGEPVGALVDAGSDAPILVYYCGDSCPLSLEIIVTDCGPTELVGKAESVSYKFTGSGSCFKISIKKDGETVVAPTPVPFLALDGEFEGPA